MTVKLLLLKSGEDIISDISEMVMGDEENQRVIGYFLDKPCVVKMKRKPIPEDGSNEEFKNSGFKVALIPWIPLSKDERIPISTDWVITMVEPATNLKEMYVEKIVNCGKQNDQSNCADKQSNSDQSD
jgi:hypothetical protein